MMKKLIITIMFIFALSGSAFSNDNRYKDYKLKLSASSTEQKFTILKEISFALEFENDVISSCVSYIKMWKETKGEICVKAFERLKGILNLMDVLGSTEYKSSFIEVSNKIDKFKLKQLQNETENGSNLLTDNLSKLNFLVQNL